MSRAKKIALWVGLALLFAMAGATIAFLIFTQSPWFRDIVKGRIERAVAERTGGSAEVGDVVIDVLTLSVRIDNFVLHGTEPAGQPPLIRAELVEGRLEWGELIQGRMRVPWLTVERPRINLLVDKNGNSNIPTPARPAEEPVLEALLDLAIGEFTLRDGLLLFDSRQIPLNLRAQNLNANLNYQPAGPNYTGSLSASTLQLDTTQAAPLTFDARTDLAIFRDRIRFSDGRLTKEQSRVLFSGAITSLDPFRSSFDVHADLAMAELAQPLNLPVARQGNVVFDGVITVGGEPSYGATGKIAGRNLLVRTEKADLGLVNFQSDVRWDPKELVLPNLQLAALGGNFTGQARLVELNHFTIAGTFRGLSLQELSRRLEVIPQLAWSGNVSGEIAVRGRLRGAASPALRGRARLEITPGPGPTPVEGLVTVDFDQPAGTIDFGDSYVQTADSRLEFTGRLGEVLRVSLESRNLDDLMPAIAMLTADPPERLPIRLSDDGVASFYGTVTGPLQDPVVEGRAVIDDFAIDGQEFDQFRTRLHVRRNALALQDIALTGEPAELRGEFAAELRDWAIADTSVIAGRFDIEGAEVQSILTATGRQLPVSGTLTGSLVISGTAGDPAAAGAIEVSQPVIAGQAFDTLTAKFDYAQNRLQVTDARAEAANARLALDATYTHTEFNWRTGVLDFDIDASGIQLAQVRELRQRTPGLEGRADLQAAGSVRLANLEPEIAILNGDLNLSNVSVDGQAKGEASLTARTAAGHLRLAASVNLGGTTMHGVGVFQLAGGMPGEGQLQINRLDFETAALLLSAGGREDLPFGGFLEGTVAFRGPLLEPENMTADAALTAVRLEPRALLAAAAEREGLAIQNDGPVLLSIDRQGIYVRQARFTGRDTNLTVAGRLAFGAASPWDLRMTGNVNLALVQAFHPDLVGSGRMVLDMVVRGPIDQPQLGGRAEIYDASLHHSSYSTGLSEASGVILFDGNRANIQQLVGEVGGGRVEITGLLGVTAGEFVFRLDAIARDVRVRYPEEVGTTFDANLSLTGTSNRSLLSGLVTVQRLVFSPRADLGGLIAASARPVAAPQTPNELLRAMHLDITVETAPDAEIISSLADRLAGSADLQVRGTAAAPSVLGRVEVSAGQIEFFGTQYTITHGEIGFFNPTRIEPVLNLSLETTARGVIVAITFAGTLDRLQVTYRSDPPLETSEIVALLAAGRDPQAIDVGVQQTATSAALLQAGATNLLGQALADPVTSRLQRVFGLSRIRLDPGLTGLDTTPEARLTIEQQVTQDITITYVSNVTDVQSEVVRLQWDISPRWSVVAVRDENGFFGLDFLLRRQF